MTPAPGSVGAMLDVAEARHRSERRRLVAIVVGVACVVSAFYGVLVAPTAASPWLSALQGATNSLMVSAPITILEVLGRRADWSLPLRRLPFVAFIVAKSILYAIVLALGSVLTNAIFAGLRHVPGGDLLPLSSLVFGLSMAVAVNLAIELGQLIGFRELGRLLAGRYHRPRREAHLFAMIDLKDSTGTAERLGDLRFHALLNAFFADIAYAATAAGADIHKYVGDEAILTWPSTGRVSVESAARLPFMVADRIARRADWYRREFGAVPRFRAALHGGDVVAGEIGTTRRELAFVGDALNTTARLMQSARDLDRDLVASAALFGIHALAGVAVDPLPPQILRGKREPLPIVALRRLDA